MIKEVSHVCKFQGNRRGGSEEEDFSRLLHYMGMAAILVT